MEWNNGMMELSLNDDEMSMNSLLHCYVELFHFVSISSPFQHSIIIPLHILEVANISMTFLFSVGSVLCDPLLPIKATSRIVARIVVFNVAMPIIKGFMVCPYPCYLILFLFDMIRSFCSTYSSLTVALSESWVYFFQVILHCQNLSETATITKLVSLLNKNTGEVEQKRPR